MSDITKEDLRELRTDLRAGIDSLREEFRGLGDKLVKHALEDADREGRTIADLGTMRTKLESLTESVNDRYKFNRGWIMGLLALAVSAVAGFIVRSSLPW